MDVKLDSCAIVVLLKSLFSCCLMAIKLGKKKDPLLWAFDYIQLILSYLLLDMKYSLSRNLILLTVSFLTVVIFIPGDTLNFSLGVVNPKKAFMNG